MIATYLRSFKDHQNLSDLVTFQSRNKNHRPELNSLNFSRVCNLYFTSEKVIRVSPGVGAHLEFLRGLEKRADFEVI